MHSFRRFFTVIPFLVGVVFAGGILTTSDQAFAQAGGTDSGSEVSLYLGSMLPHQIDGVTEILPFFGARYGFQTTSIGVAEFAFTNAHAEGVDFTTFSGSLRADLPAIDQFIGFLFGGIDFHYYRPLGESDRKTDTGVHVGTGLLVHVSDTLWVRSDLKFNAQPGTAMQFQFGLVFKTY